MDTVAIDLDRAYQRHKQAIDESDLVMRIPRSSLWNVLEVAVEYDFASLPTLLQPKVLDIGANMGVFAIACCQLFPGARVMSFEPHPETFQHLKHNVSGMPVEVHNQAVIGWQRSDPKDVVLHEGKRTRLCCSLFDVGDQDMTTAIPVATMLAADLPPCDVLKLDTEGAEVEILESYRHLGSVKALLCEAHGKTPEALEQQIKTIAGFAHKAGLTLKDHRANTLRFVRHA